jgi:hypothetical protein
MCIIHPRESALGRALHQWHKFGALKEFGGKKEASLNIFNSKALGGELGTPMLLCV